MYDFLKTGRLDMSKRYARYAFIGYFRANTPGPSVFHNVLVRKRFGSDREFTPTVVDGNVEEFITEAQCQDVTKKSAVLFPQEG